MSGPPHRRFNVHILSLLPDAVVEQMTAELVAARALKNAQKTMAAAIASLARADDAHARVGSAETLIALEAAGDAVGVVGEAVLDALLKQERAQAIAVRRAPAASTSVA